MEHKKYTSLKNSLKVKGFTLVELQVGIIISGILVLMIGAMSTISTHRFRSLQAESAVYQDLSYGLKLVQNRVRRAADTPAIVTSSEPQWVSQQLVVDNGAFGLYKTPGSSQTDFVYLKNRSDESLREVIMSVGQGEKLNLTLTQNADAIVLKLDGKKKDIPFDLSSRIMRRIQ